MDKYFFANVDGKTSERMLTKFPKDEINLFFNIDHYGNDKVRITDGLALAAELIDDALSFIAPYTGDCAACRNALFIKLANNAIEKRDTEPKAMMLDFGGTDLPAEERENLRKQQIETIKTLYAQFIEDAVNEFEAERAQQQANNHSSHA